MDGHWLRRGEKRAPIPVRRVSDKQTPSQSSGGAPDLLLTQTLHQQELQERINRGIHGRNAGCMGALMSVSGHLEDFSFFVFFSRGISKWIKADGAAEAERLGPLTGCIVA